MQNYYDFDYKKVGWADRGVYRQVSSGREDMKNNSWGILLYIVQDFKKKKVKQVRILDTDDNTVYITPAKEYLDALEKDDMQTSIHVPLKKFKTINYVRKNY